MTMSTHLAEIDPLTPEEVKDLAADDGPCVSIFLPTARFGPGTLEGPVRLRNALRDVRPGLHEARMADPDIDEMLEPLRELVDDDQFWQHQADGLALFASPTRHRAVRVPISFDESAVVGPRFRLLPLWPMVDGDDVFHVLALSQNQVRLFEATSLGIAELEPGPIPTSMEEALAHEDGERQIQTRAAGPGGSELRVHGHGAGDELDKAALERFFRAVDAGVVARLGPTRQPVVLACVDYYLPIYQRVTQLPNIATTAVSGNPEHRSAEELHAAALEVVEPIQAEQRATTAARFEALGGTGTTLTEAPDIVTAAHEGRVDTLLIRGEDPSPDDPPLPSVVDSFIDMALADVLGYGGSVEVVEEVLDPDTPVAAILRY